LRLKTKMHVLAGGRLVDHADGDDEFNHFDPQVEGLRLLLQAILFRPGWFLDAFLV
jgi:hypothetical protein